MKKYIFITFAIIFASCDRPGFSKRLTKNIHTNIYEIMVLHDMTNKGDTIIYIDNKYVVIE